MPDNKIKTISQADAETMYSMEGIAGMSHEELGGYDNLTGTLSAFIAGAPFTGKTLMLGTAPLPLLIYSFDPKKTQSLWLTYPELMKSRWITVIPFWNEDSKNPTEFKQWDDVVTNHIETGFLNRFGSVAIDSYTGWLRCAGNYVLKDQNKKRSMKQGGKQLDNLAMSDYPVLYNLSHTMVSELSNGSWNFIVTGHLNIIRDEETGTDLRVELSVYNQLKTFLPGQFAEFLLLRKKEIRKDNKKSVKYELLTDATGIYTIAGSQLAASGELDKIEIPNFRHLFAKVGSTFKDKPHWETGKVLDPELCPENIKKYL